MNTTEHLVVLRDRLRSRTMSVLVGAGFSKNVSNDLFPNWNQLLRKLVISFKGANILKQYRSLKTDYTIQAEDPNFEKFLDLEVSTYIEANGYLNVVSDYIRYTGIRESIDSFIEENTPIAIRLDDTDCLRCYQHGQLQLVNLASNSLDLHRKLINFPWNNVYTTNYDNLLEYCIDENIIGKIKSRIEAIEVNIDRLTAENNNLAKELRELEDEITLDEEQILNASLSKSAPADAQNSKVEDELEEKRRRQNFLQWKLNTLTGEISDLFHSKLQFQRSKDDCYQVVCRSSQLSLKKHRNIIKLHGTIYADDYHSSFDADVHKRYIISREDYDTYPAKHEAFTQLMRISLLQEYFMLIGFSGDDPNFLAWVSWVRDVIQKGQNPDELGKIYLIDVRSDGKTDRYKEQFYRNHQIVHIPLQSPPILELLSKHHSAELLSDDYGGILSAFLHFLGDGAPYNPSEVAFEKLHQAEYEQYFRKLPVYIDASTDIDLSNLLNNKSVIRTARHCTRMTSIQSPFTFSKVNYVDSFEQIVTRHPQELEALLEVAIACLMDLHIPYSCLIEHNSVLFLKIEEKLADYDKCDWQLQWLHVFNLLWQQDLNTVRGWVQRSSKLPDDLKNHLLCLASLFEFDFSTAQQIIKCWTPDTPWQVIKAGLQSHTDQFSAKQMLKNVHSRIVQEELFRIELLLILSGSSREKRLRDIYDQLNHDGLKHVYSMVGSLLRDLLPSQDRVTVRGNNKFISSSGLHLTNISSERSSLQIFGLMMESGLPLSLGNNSLYNFQSIFPAIITSIRFFPVPILFYALQYDDIQFLKRVGQEFAIEQNVDSEHQRILTNLTAMHTDPSAPGRFKSSSLFFLSEFVIAVEPALWASFFIDIWNEAVRIGEPLKDARSPHMQFIAKALPMIRELSILGKVLNDSLSLAGTDMVAAMISCTYYLQSNQQFQQDPNYLRKNLDNHLLSNIILASESDLNYLLVLGNLSRMLNSSDSKAVNARLRNLDFRALNPTLIEVVLALLKDNKGSLAKKLIESLVDNQALWRTGLSDNHVGVVGPAPFIKMRVLRKQSAWVDLEKTKVKKIYTKMTDEVRKISEFMRNEHAIDGLVNFRSILQEMIWFLKDEGSKLKDESTLERIIRTIQTLFLKNMYGVSKLEALMSDDLVNLNWAILSVSRDIADYHGTLENDIELRQLFARISQKNPIGLESSIYHLVSWFNDLRDTDLMKPFLKEALLMMSRYRSDTYPPGCEVSLIEEKLIHLAYVLRFWGIAEDVVDHFCQKIFTSRFNNVRYSLLARLKGDGMIN
jgi:regulator of replication initiation timing